MTQIGKITSTLMLIILILLPTFKGSASYIFILHFKFKTRFEFVHYSSNKFSGISDLIVPQI